MAQTSQQSEQGFIAIIGIVVIVIVLFWVALSRLGNGDPAAGAQKASDTIEQAEETTNKAAELLN